jgi:choline dehydrogenase-like flavoprotein
VREMMIMATNIRTWFLLLTMLTMMSSNQLLSSSQAARTPSDAPFAFITVDGNRAASRPYDYIVVGGGTAGCPLATTLSANYSVLVIERGGSPYGNPDIENGNVYGKLLGETNNYTSPAQTFISEDGVTLYRARVLGGATTLNAGFYSRASSKYVTKMEWDEGLVKDSYEWVEKQNAFEPHNLSSWSSAFRDGLLQAGVVPYNGYTLDHVEGTKISASIFDNNWKRHTAADLLKTANPNNIVVLLNATVSRILFNSPTSQGKPRARGVELVDDNGRSYQALLTESSCSSEVILSAGSIGSPQLLLLSGIGPSEHLQEFNIPLVLHLPLVGKGIQDSPRATVTVQTPTPHEFSSIQAVGILPGSQNYIESSFFVEPNNLYVGSIFEKLGIHLSRGELRLRSTDPRDNPSVRYNYYSHPLDLKRCVDGVRVIDKILKSRSLQRFTFAAANGFSPEFHFIGRALPKNTWDDAAVVQFCRDTLDSMWHFHGGCHVGPVVNHRYQVNGVESLRIVDGSTFEDAPGTNPQATTLMLGRYVGTKILRERNEGY